MMNMKKALIACTVLTAFAASAFAAETNDNKTSMKERVRKIQCENQKQAGFHKKQGPAIPRPKLTQEERAKFKEMTPEQRKAFMKQKHAEFRKSLSPEDRARYDEHQKMMKERREAHKKLVAEKMGKLSKAQKAEVEQFIKDDIAHRKAMKERMHNMTPEQREAIRVAHPVFGKMHRPGPKPGMKGHGPNAGHRMPAPQQQK